MGCPCSARVKKDIHVVPRLPTSAVAPTKSMPLSRNDLRNLRSKSILNAGIVTIDEPVAENPLRKVARRVLGGQTKPMSGFLGDAIRDQKRR